MTNKPGTGEKRAAFEPGAGLIEPIPIPPERRPAATTLGAILVLFRIAFGGLWLISLGLDWNRIVDGNVSIIGDFTPDQQSQVTQFVLYVFLSLGVLVLLGELFLTWLIFLGWNWPRIVVMIVATVSISSAAVDWWLGDQEITVRTTLLTVSLDILVLLALSSQAARAYALRPRQKLRARKNHDNQP